MAEEIFRLASLLVLLIGPEVSIDPAAEVHVERILYVPTFLPMRPGEPSGWESISNQISQLLRSKRIRPDEVVERQRNAG
jgi:hypothetical protein